MLQAESDISLHRLVKQRMLRHLSSLVLLMSFRCDFTGIDCFVHSCMHTVPSEPPITPTTTTTTTALTPTSTTTTTTAVPTTTITTTTAATTTTTTTPTTTTTTTPNTTTTTTTPTTTTTTTTPTTTTTTTTPTTTTTSTTTTSTTTSTTTTSTTTTTTTLICQTCPDLATFVLPFNDVAMGMGPQAFDGVVTLAPATTSPSGCLQRMFTCSEQPATPSAFIAIAIDTPSIRPFFSGGVVGTQDGSISTTFTCDSTGTHYTYDFTGVPVFIGTPAQRIGTVDTGVVCAFSLPAG